MQCCADAEVCKGRPHLAVVRMCMRGDADILYSADGESDPTLHRCIVNGHVGALKELLETSRAVDFRVKDTEQRSPLHCVLVRCSGEARLAPETMRMMSAAIVSRLAAHPGDVVDWSQASEDGHDFLSLAAREGVLPELYPVVKGVEQYVRAVKPLVLTCMPCSDDWLALSEEDRSVLRFAEPLCSAALNAEVCKGRPHLAVVRMCMRGDADILYSADGESDPTLHRCIVNGHVGALKALLETSRAVDFTRRGVNGYCALHQLPLTWSCSTVREMLIMILERVRLHPDDAVDWWQQSDSGHNFLSLAVCTGVLSAVYPLVKDLDWFVKAVKPIPLKNNALNPEVGKRGLRLLSKTEQALFKLTLYSWK